MDGGKLLDSYLQVDKKNNLSKIVTKILCCLIFLFASLIFTSLNDENLVFYKKYVFEDNFEFMNFKNFYKKFSSSGKKEDTTKMVFGSTLEYTNISPYQNGQSLEIGSEVPINSLTGGIVVFAGIKEGFNNTIIIQGSDGYDIWYGNLSNVDIGIYDYVDAGTIIASASDNLYLLITKDAKYFTYEEYQNQI
ncbi:MAG: M23 family metallopeptidase [Firmicutes bacterium]|nr:M23 family metallopeptidase [Bacillota bacterium]